jgi:hypothetical protein
MNHPQKGTRVSKHSRSAKTPSLRTGLFAPLSSLLGAKGSGAPLSPRTRRLALVPLLGTLGLVLFVPEASAVRIHPPEGIFGAAAQPSFSQPSGMAVDATGNVLVIDISTKTISRFKPDGTPAEFSALGTNVIDGKSGPGPKPPQGEILGNFGNRNEVGVAVDTSGGVADGSIYVTDSPHHVIDIFSPTGEYKGQLTEFGGSPLGETFGVTVDSSGAVYVSDVNNGVQKYVPSANPATDADFVKTFSVFRPAAIAAGKGASAGSLFVDEYVFGEITKISSSTGEFESLISEPDSGFNFKVVAVDPTTGYLYYSDGTKVFGVDANGATPKRITSATIAAGSAVEGLGINASGQIFLGRSGLNHVEVYGPSGPPTPFVESQSAIQVIATEATLKALINPEGSATSFRVDYGPTAAYGESTSVESVGSDETSHAVQAQIKNLNPGTEYHFRFVATNTAGTTEGNDRTFRTSTPGSEAQSCPNQVFRAGAGAQLPDCRAYEMVTPVEKGGFNIEPPLALGPFRAALYQASTSGNALTYATSQGFAAPEGAPYSRQYLATRTGSGWESSSLAEPQRPSQHRAADRVDLEYRIFSPDLCHGGLMNWSEPALVPPAVNGVPNIYARDLCGASGLSAVSISPHLTQPEVGGISADGRCVVYFANSLNLTTIRTEGKEDPGGLYELCGSNLTRLDLLPDGSLSDGFVVPGTRATSTGLEFMLREAIMGSAVSENASTVYWTDIGTDPGSGQLFVRINAQAPQSALGPANECLEPTKGCTLPVSAAVEPGTSHVAFAAASADGSRAYYYLEQGPSAGNLYEFDLASRSSRLIATGLARTGSTFQLITPVIGASADGSRVYFFSTAALDGEGVNGELNLFLFEAASAATAGSTRLVATMPLASNSRERELNPVEPAYFRSSRITSDGLHAVFTSDQPLTGYDNRALGSGKPAVEVYVYDALANGGQGGLSCVSCNPTGQRPEARPILRQDNSVPSQAEYAGVIPGYYTTFHGARAITDDGTRVFFEAFDALLPQDTNGRADVYEWTREGAPGCSTRNPSYSPLNGGCLSLISSGESSSDSRLIDATADGSDVFFATSQSLVPEDPGLVDVYDARINGGFPPPPGLAPACEGEACQSPAAPPIDQTPGSFTFSGAGNLHSEPPPVNVKPKALTRAQKLSRALHACERKPKRTRTRCKALARKRYGRSAKRSNVNGRRVGR